MILVLVAPFSMCWVLEKHHCHMVVIAGTESYDGRDKKVCTIFAKCGFRNCYCLSRPQV